METAIHATTSSALHPGSTLNWTVLGIKTPCSSPRRPYAEDDRKLRTRPRMYSTVPEALYSTTPDGVGSCARLSASAATRSSPSAAPSTRFCTRGRHSAGVRPRPPTSNRGGAMHDSANELRRIHLLRNRVNSPSE
jgi:hypothetical protein